MLGLFRSLAAVFVVISIGYFAWTHRDRVTIPAVALPAAANQPADSPAAYPESVIPRDMVTLTGPLASYISHQQSETPHEAESAQHSPRPRTEFDQVGDSPVGTTTPILHKTFTLSKAANLPFELPAYASNPKLRGTYSSFVQHADANSNDEANVEFLLLNEQQYSDFLQQRPGDALFSAEGAQDQEINVSMPPTNIRPVKYHLVFRNDSRDAGKAGAQVAVRADFRVDF